MWPFRRVKTCDAGEIFRGFTDFHSHILPAVDDGVGTMAESLEILARYERLGVRSLWLTPHIMEDIPNTTAHLRERFGELKTAYNGNIELHLAAEHMLDNLFEERLEARDVLPLGTRGDQLLVETSYFNAPINMTETLEAVKSSGYYPVLAHPERYFYIDSLADYRQLKARGVRFQLNIMSLCGHYGPTVRDKASRLLAEGMYDCCGSDMHHIRHLDVMNNLRLTPDKAQLIQRINF